MKFRLFTTLLSPDDALDRSLRATEPIRRTETISVSTALGRVAAEPVRAPRPVPPTNRATWDGYAVRAADLRGASAERPAELRLVGSAYAEDRLVRRLRPGQTIAVATGARMPAGANAVVIAEHARVVGSRVRIARPVAPGDRVVRAGEDFPRGTLLAAQGDVLGAAQLGAIASAGRAGLTVYAQPRVAIVPNGNELVPPGVRPAPGQIVESNNVALAAVVRAAGGVPILYPPVPDDPRTIERVLRRAADRADLVLATGGSSVGEHDWLPTVFSRIGRRLFHGIAVRPGKPTLAAVRRGRLLIGLPGHPTSCLANSFWLVTPVLRRLARLPGPGWSDGTARWGGPTVAPTPGFAMVVPIRLVRGRAYSTFRDSSAITSLFGASAYALLPPRRRPVRPGDRIPIRHLWPPLGPPVPVANR